MARPTIIVAGGGIAGLTAAAYVARSGANVTLYERAADLGGRARTTYLDGVRFNFGPHALYQEGAADEVISDLGIAYTHGRPAVGGAFAIRGGRRFPMPGGARAVTSTGLLGRDGQAQVAAGFAAIRAADTSELQSTTLADWLSRHVTRVAPRQLLEASFRVSTYSNGPSIVSAGSMIDHYRKSAKPVRYIDGGWQTLVDELRRVALEASAHIVSGRRVESVRIDGSARGVVLAGGEKVDADAVILATEPGVAASLLPGNDAFRQRVEALLPIEAACLDLALTSLPAPKRTFGLGIDQPLYFSVHSAGAKLSPGGEAVIHIAKYLPIGEESDPEAALAQLEACADLLQPGWRERVIHRRYLPSMTVVHAAATAATGGVTGRPAIDAPGIPGVFIAGDWVGPEGMLVDVAFGSGRDAALAAVASPVRELAAV